MNVATGSVKIGTIGAIIIIDCYDKDGNQLDVSGAASLKIRFMKPNGSTLEVDAVVHNTYSVKYTTTADDDGEGNTLLTESKQWRATPYIGDLDGFTGYIQTMYFNIKGYDE